MACRFVVAQVQEVLDAQPVGTFICRESSQKGMYAISVQQVTWGCAVPAHVLYGLTI